MTQQSPEGKTACITLDLENNWKFESANLQYLVLDYLDEYIELIQSLDVPVTVFVVGQLLEERPDAVWQLDAELDVEFHLHSYSHDMNGTADIEREIRDGIEAFETVFGRKPAGYRAPRFILNDGDLAALAEADFVFDSSVCPSYRPGVYNNLEKPMKPYVPDEAPDLLEIPISAHPRLRVPFSQSYLRLLRGPYLALIRRSRLPNPLVFDSHLHDFFHTRSHDQLEGIRRFLFKYNIDNSEDIFRQFVTLLRERGYQFQHLSTLASRNRSPQSELTI